MEEVITFFREKESDGIDCISGKTALLERIAPAFPQWKIDSTYMSRCNDIEEITKSNQKNQTAL